MSCCVTRDLGALDDFRRANSHVFFFFFGLKGTAGAGSLILEFSLLSRLTGDDRYEVGLINFLSS